MDDFLGGANTKQETLQLWDNLRKIMHKGGFELRKWMFNDCELLKDVYSAENESMKVLELENKMAKILGLLWCPECDVFRYNIHINENSKHPLTKRKILCELLLYLIR